MLKRTLSASYHSQENKNACSDQERELGKARAKTIAIFFPRSKAEAPVDAAKPEPSSGTHKSDDVV